MYGAAPTTTPKPNARVNAPTRVLGSVTTPAIAEPRLGSARRRLLLASSARPATSEESVLPGGSGGASGGDGVDPCVPDDASGTSPETLGTEEPGAGGKPGTLGRLGPADPSSSWPGTCSSRPRPGTPMSIGVVVTGGRIWACAGAATAIVAPSAAAATATARTTAGRRITSPPLRVRRRPRPTLPPASTRRTQSPARARSRG